MLCANLKINRGFLTDIFVELHESFDATFVRAVPFSFGISRSLYPVKGYSLTVALEPGDKAPAVGGIDGGNRVACGSMWRRSRVAAAAEFAGCSTSYRPGDFRKTLPASHDLFTDCGDFSRPGYRAGPQPMIPGDMPIPGFGKHRNL